MMVQIDNVHEIQEINTMRKMVLIDVVVVDKAIRATVEVYVIVVKIQDQDYQMIIISMIIIIIISSSF